MGLIFKWRRDKGRDYFHEADVSELVSAVKGGNRPTALRKAVGIINATMNDLPQGINKHTPTTFDNDPKKLEEYANQLQTLADGIDLKLGKEKLQPGKRKPNPAQVEAYNKDVDTWNKLEEDAKKLDQQKPEDKKKLDALAKQQTAIKAKLAKFDTDFPDYDPDEEADPADKTSELPSTGEDGVGVVSWLLIAELVVVVIQIIRDIIADRKANPKAVKA